MKHARHRATGGHFAVKILDRGRVLSLRGADDQVRREIATLTMLAHPNVVRLHEVISTNRDLRSCCYPSGLRSWSQLPCSFD